MRLYNNHVGQTMQRKLSLHYSNVDGIGDVVPMLEGHLEKLPPLVKRNVRVFLSSTFSGKMLGDFADIDSYLCHIL